MVSCGIVVDWDEAERCDDFSDFVIVLDSLYLLGEWIHLVLAVVLVFRWWGVLAFYAIRIAFFFVAALLSVPGFRHVGAQA